MSAGEYKLELTANRFADEVLGMDRQYARLKTARRLATFSAVFISMVFVIAAAYLLLSQTTIFDGPRFDGPGALVWSNQSVLIAASSFIALLGATFSVYAMSEIQRSLEQHELSATTYRLLIEKLALDEADRELSGIQERGNDRSDLQQYKIIIERYRGLISEPTKTPKLPLLAG